MLSDDHHPGLFYFLVGMAVVIVGGLALSMLTARRLAFSSSRVALEAAVVQNARELEDLRRQYRERCRKMEEVATRLDLAERHAAEVGRLGQGAAELVRLMAARTVLEQDLATLEQDVARYRGAYRQQTWAAAAGQKIPLVTTLGGREYRDVTIVRVTEVGMEIRHGQDGIARIAAPELGPAWHERFQWDDPLRRARNAEGHRSGPPATGQAPAPGASH